MSAISKIKAQYGLANEIANFLGVHRSTVSKWKRIPAERVLDVEEVTGISREELRPDLYPRVRRKRIYANEK